MTTTKKYEAKVDASYILEDGVIGKHGESGFLCSVKVYAYKGADLVAEGDYSGCTADEIAEGIGEGWDLVEIKTWDGELVGTIERETETADDEWEAQQAAQIKNELEYEIATMKERMERKEKLGYFDGKRGQAMRRHYERKLANAEALHAELFGNGEQVDEIEQAAQTVKDAGGVVVLPENRERFDAQLKQLHDAEGACDAALAKVNKLTAAIDDMKYDCDGEVYETLLVIADILGR